jgi:hypothetical protein
MPPRDHANRVRTCHLCAVRQPGAARAHMQSASGAAVANHSGPPASTVPSAPPAWCRGPAGPPASPPNQAARPRALPPPQRRSLGCSSGTPAAGPDEALTVAPPQPARPVGRAVPSPRVRTPFTTLDTDDRRPAAAHRDPQQRPIATPFSPETQRRAGSVIAAPGPESLST